MVGEPRRRGLSAAGRTSRRLCVLVIFLAVSMMAVNLAAALGGMWSVWHTIGACTVGLCLIGALGGLVWLKLVEQGHRPRPRRVDHVRGRPPG